ncbi:porin [Burkholderia guangdongensis]|uniref:porin n=1 Tax=Burkholderia guangdongensis TaxID=1792500 RepID=UPI0015CBE406|nr:porin [Burkholderia guangdongensis]
MKKRYLAAIAAAATALAGGAHAQSSVTLYGMTTVDLQFVNHVQNVVNGVKVAGSGSELQMSPSGIAQSRFGLRGNEDLGGGYSAIFTLENQFNTNNGQLGNGGLLFGRQAFVGLGSQYGKITFGRQYTSSFVALADYTPLYYSPEFEPVVAMSGPSFRENSMVKYEGQFGPLLATAHWSFGGRAGSFGAGSGYGAGLSYSAGAFGIGLGFDNVNNLSAQEFVGASGGNDYGRDMRAFVGLRYTYQTLKFVAGYRWGNTLAPSSGSPLYPPHQDDMVWAGINWTATPAAHFIVGYYYDDIRHATLNGTVVKPKPLQQYVAIADYSLSKATDLYASAMYSRNASLNWDNVGYLPNGQSVGYYLPSGAQTYYMTPGSSGQLGLSVGIRHVF